MESIVTSIIVFVCTFGGVLLGMFLSNRLPAHHLGDKSIDVVKLATALMGTMAALLLGLQLDSAKDSFNALSNEVAQASGKVILLDRTLARYGPEAQPIREALKAHTERVLEQVWPSRLSANAGRVEAQDVIYTKLQALSPTTEAQQSLRSHAIELAFAAAQTRWIITAKQSSTVSALVITVLVFWLTIIFISFGLFAPRNTTVVVSLGLCAMSFAVAIFLLLEMSTPFSGVLRVSDAPLRTAVSYLGR
jgi:hypothetical protein